MVDAEPPPSTTPTPLPLVGVRVVEIGRFASAPACATVLSDWGADVIKIEPLTGDPARGPGTIGAAGRTEGWVANPRFDVHNRSRRSLALALDKPDGLTAALAVIATADVVVTNLRDASLTRLGLNALALRSRDPRLVFAQITGYDRETSLAGERSYDHGAFWSYSGVADMFATAGGEPPQPTGGLGDRATGSLLAGAITAALFGRERTGQGAEIRTSLVNTALWLMASDVSDAVVAPRKARSHERVHAPIPTLNCYRTADGRWLWLQVMVPDHQWPDLLGALDASWLDDDPRFKDGDSRALAAASVEVVGILDRIFAGRTLADWGRRLSDHGLTWAAVRSVAEVVEDPEIRASSAFATVTDPDGTIRPTVNTPCTFVEATEPARSAAPAPGADSATILGEIGYGQADIARLVDQGIVAGRRSGEVTGER